MSDAKPQSPNGRITPVVLCGGTGTRLWPLSRALLPKQLQPLVSERTLLQETLARLPVNGEFGPPVIVCNEEHRFAVAEQVRQLGIAPRAVLLEPEGRNTAPAAAAAAILVTRDEPDAMLLIVPSDHVVGRPDRFRALVSSVSGIRDRLVTFGVAPSRPETGYGYIEIGEPLAPGSDIFSIRAFVEKPEVETAGEYVRSGRYLWNSGMFLFPAALFLSELENYAPEVVAACRASVSASEADLGFCRLNRNAFLSTPSVSIDVAVMERTRSGAVAPIDVGWSDIGSWDALWRALPKSELGNVVEGSIIPIDSHDCYLRSTGPVVASVGLENAVVVATRDAVLVTTRDRAQDVRRAVEQLAKAGRQEHMAPPETFRPWGSFQTIDSGDRFQVKRIVVQPGQRLSLQMHHHRAEHWVVVRGTARVTRGEETFLLGENESTYIPIGMMHRLENPGRVPLHLIEIQSGPYLCEDDIVRFDDHYGRA